MNCFSLVFIARENGKKGETRSCESPVRCPPFFIQAPVDWFGWVPITGLSWLPSRLTCGTFQFHHAPSTQPSIADGLMWLKCNLGSSLHHQSNMGWSWALALFYSTFPIVNHFAHVAMLLLLFLLPALPSLWVFSGKYLHISPLTRRSQCDSACSVPLIGSSWLPSRLTCNSLQFHQAPFAHLSFVNGFNLQNLM